MTFTIAIVGRPNVGKSTLFNRLAGKRLAIVDNTPGVTRDRREGDGRIGMLRFRVIDTAGLEDDTGETLEAAMRRQTERAFDQADVALLLIDARAGVTPMDQHFATLLRRRTTPVIICANKCEGGAGAAGLLDCFALGHGDPVAISAEHGEGLLDLADALAPFLPEGDHADGTEDGDEDGNGRDGLPEDDDEDPGKPLQLAIVGRPNVGKSTLINRLLGDERMLTGPLAGVTRDAIATPWEFEGRAVQLVDTAGLRRRARVDGRLEGLSVGDALRAVRYAHVVVLVMEADNILDKQDLTIARRVIDEGRALVIALNKWDIAGDRKASLARLNDRLQTSLPRVRGLPVTTISALTGKGVERLMPSVIKAYDVWNKRISTGALNRWFMEASERHPPPLAAGRRIKIRYITQAKARPPTFVLFASRPDSLPESYVRYLENGIRENFGLPGTPIRLHVRKGKNPYK